MIYGAATELECNPNIIIELGQVFMLLPPGSVEGPSARLLFLLDSLGLAVERPRKVLESLSACRDTCHKVGESTISNNGFTKTTSTKERVKRLSFLWYHS